MTWATRKSTGEGAIEYRLEIEGWPYIFCTAGLATGSVSDGRTRVGGLEASGLTIQERIVLPEGVSQGSGMRASLVDLSAQATAAFTTEPTNVSWINGDFDSTDTVFTLTDTGPFSADDYVHVGTEVLKIDQVLSSTTLEVTRAQWSTAAQAHSSVPGADLRYPEVTDVPVLMQGRRAWLYAHGPTELATSSGGTLIWRMIVGEEPRQSDPAKWSILLNPLTSLLDQELASGIDEPFYPAGIYYAWNDPFVLWLTEMAGTTPDSGSGLDALVVVSGHFDTQQDFADAVNAEIVAQTGSFSAQSIRVQVDPDGWALFFLTKATSPLFMSAFVFSRIDGELLPQVYDVATDVDAYSVSADTLYRYHWRDVRTPPAEAGPPLRAVPRAQYIGSAYSLDEATSAPRYRIFLDRAHLLSAGDALMIGDHVLAKVESVDAATGQVDLEDDDGERIEIPYAWHGGVGPAIRAIQWYGDAGTDLAGLRNSITTESKDDTAHTMPFIATTDWPDIQTAVTDAAGGRPFLLSREYAFAKPVRLRELLQHELRMLGAFLHLNSTGALTVSVLRPQAPTGSSVDVLDKDSVVDFATLDISPDGVLNVVQIKTGWSRTEEKFLGRPWYIRDVKSISRLHRRRTLDVAPEVASAADISTVEEARSIADPYALFSERYYVAEIAVTWKQYDLLIGDAVYVDLDHLPNDGSRGLTKTGLVIGRRWDLFGASGTVWVLLHSLNISGYTPSARVSSATGGATTWTLNLEASRYAPSGEIDSDWFRVGDQVRVYRWDDPSPYMRSATVKTVSTNQLIVDLDEPYAGISSGGTWNVAYDEATGATDHQRTYAFVANSGGRVDDGGGLEQPARVFA